MICMYICLVFSENEIKMSGSGYFKPSIFLNEEEEEEEEYHP